ncbi:MAG: 3-phosphoshikimate 1-carboxyvinyltransferase [Lentisphaeria bacterium]
MDFICHPSTLRGEAVIPGSKSHTLRAVMLAGIATGESVIEAPLVSADALSGAAAIATLGATVTRGPDAWRVTGCGGIPVPDRPEIDVGNSGTSMNILLGLTALLRSGEVTLTGDHQIRRRPSGNLADALVQLGADIVAVNGNGCPPFRVRGGLRGGRATLEARSSQYLTSLLLACPLAAGDSEITVTGLKEQPYVHLTLDWLRFLSITVEHTPDLSHFRIPGGQQYRAFHRRIPGDFSSASFFLCAGALPGNDVTCRNLDPADTQGDKAVADYLRAMGAEVTAGPDWIRVRGRSLSGLEIDLDPTPDALPVMAVMGCLAGGTTALRNVAHARIKETDRIAVMAGELRKLGAAVEELPDGLLLHGGRPLHGAAVNGHGDHRVVMAMALAGLSVPGELRVDTAEAAGVTFPEFHDLMRGLGGDLVKREG